MNTTVVTIATISATQDSNGDGILSQQEQLQPAPINPEQIKQQVLSEVEQKQQTSDPVPNNTSNRGFLSIGILVVLAIGSAWLIVQKKAR